ncbi:MAG TPA: hypothetical protein VFZ25_17605 [Chloroflexota bacterium]|nr:hypothetical protein [Chloroflexota bacterium]
MLDYLEQWFQQHRSELGVPEEEFRRANAQVFESLLASTEKLSSSLEVKLCESLQGAIRMMNNPVQAAIFARGIEAVARMTAGIDETEGMGALAHSSDQDFLIDILRQSSAGHPADVADPLREARLRGLHMRERILEAEGGCWSAEEVGQHLRISRQAVDRRRQRGQLLALPIGGKSYVYPSWQFVDTGVLPGFVETLNSFTLPGPWTQAAFFLSPNALLAEQRPLDELRKGNLEAVKAAAASYGEQIAA